MVAALHGVEVEARRRGHSRLIEHPATEMRGIVREVRDIGVEIEGAIRRMSSPEAQGREGIEQQRPVSLVAGSRRLDFLDGIEGGQSRHLRQVGRVVSVNEVEIRGGVGAAIGQAA